MGKYHSELLMLFNLAFLMKCKYIILNDKEIMYHIMYNRLTLIQFMFADLHFKSFSSSSQVKPSLQFAYFCNDSGVLGSDRMLLVNA